MFMKNLSYLFVIILALVTAPLAHASEKQAYIADYAALLSKYVQEGKKQEINRKNYKAAKSVISSIVNALY